MASSTESNDSLAQGLPNLSSMTTNRLENFDFFEIDTFMVVIILLQTDKCHSQ